MSWLERILSKSPIKSSSRSTIPEGLWTKCTDCEQILYKNELVRNLEICPKCGCHMAIDARTRLLAFLDEDGITEIGEDLEAKDILKFKDLKRYKDRLSAAQKSTNEKEALVVLSGKLHGMPVVVAGFNFNFMGGSMGTVVGSKFVMAAERALKKRCAFICFSASGGARMQEGLFSLMQMARTSAALAKLRTSGIPFISVLTNPTFGGVSASLAMLGDINIAEPKALIGFAGARVIQQTVRETLPPGFQRAEFLMEKGSIDLIIHRKKMRDEVAKIVAMLTKKPSPIKEIELLGYVGADT